MRVWACGRCLAPATLCGVNGAPGSARPGAFAAAAGELGGCCPMPRRGGQRPPCRPGRGPWPVASAPAKPWRGSSEVSRQLHWQGTSSTTEWPTCPHSGCLAPAPNLRCRQQSHVRWRWGTRHVHLGTLTLDAGQVPSWTSRERPLLQLPVRKSRNLFIGLRNSTVPNQT